MTNWVTIETQRCVPLQIHRLTSIEGVTYSYKYLNIIQTWPWALLTWDCKRPLRAVFAQANHPENVRNICKKISMRLFW